MANSTVSSQSKLTVVRPIELSFALPRAHGTRIYLQLTIRATSVLLFLTTAQDGVSSTASLGSFVFAIPDGVFTFLLDKLGVKDVQFEELVALDAEYLRQLSPIYGLIFLFKYLAKEQAKSDGQPQDGRYDYEASEKLFFAKQTIQNACGTQALLSVLLNKDNEIDVGTQLREFKDFAAALPSEFKGEALSNSELIRDVHNSFSRSNPFVDETEIQTENGDAYHFIAYTSINNILYELDGLHCAPISHGCSTIEDFPDKIVEIIQRRIARYPQHEIRFNLLAMVRDLRMKALEIGDQEMLSREEQKRKGWLFENALRRHNFLGFTGELLKEMTIAKIKESPNAYGKWLESSRQDDNRNQEADVD